MLVDDWADLVRVVVVGTCSYLSLLVLLRVSGKRTLAKLNAFDFVVTVALGSTLSSVLLSSDVALAEGVTAMVLLVGLQFLVAWLSVRSRTVEGLVKSEPTLVYRDGFLLGPMRRMRVTDDEIRQAARTAGHARLAERRGSRAGDRRLVERSHAAAGGPDAHRRRSHPGRRRVTSALKGLAHRFWAVPLLFAITAVLLALGVTALDESLDTSLRLPFLFAGGPEGARALLAAIITSMISFTALVFSITIVVLQLTSSQFSPRVLRSFLQDRFNQVALGVFVATFVYALVVLRGVRGTAQVDPFVPQIGVTAAFAFVLTSVMVFLAYIHHIAQSIRAATILASIADDTRALLDERVPADSRWNRSCPRRRGRCGTSRPADLACCSGSTTARLSDAAQRHGVSVELLRAVGEFVPAGAPLALVHGDAPFDDNMLHAAVHFGRERSMDQDVGFGLRQLVDIAERALSPGVNDPTTAVQAIDHLHDIMRRLATRALPPRQHVTDDGQFVLSVPQPRFSDYLALAFDEILRWGEDRPTYPTSGASRAPRPGRRSTTRAPSRGARGNRAPPCASADRAGRRAVAVRHRASLSSSLRGAPRSTCCEGFTAADAGP